MKILTLIIHLSILIICFISLILLYIDLLNKKSETPAKNEELDRLLNENVKEKIDKVKYLIFQAKMKLDNNSKISTEEVSMLIKIEFKSS